MYNIILLCQHGASTGIVADRIQAAAAQAGIACVVNAYSESKAATVIPSADLVMIAPQIRFKRRSLEKTYGSQGVKFMDINPMDYGMMNGEKILKAAMDILS